MGSEVQLRVWQSGEYSLVSEGQDGSQTLLDHYGNGIVRYVEVDDEGWRKTVFAMAGEDGGIETALLAPAEDAALDAPPEPRVRYAGGIAHLEMASPARWREQFGGDPDLQRAARGYAAYEARLRQFAAVLAAHGIEAVFDYIDA